MDEDKSMAAAEKNLQKSIDDIFRLFLFDLAALVYVRPEKKVQVNNYEWTGEELIIDGYKQTPSFRACLSEKQFKTLNKYAYKTYAPATDESRLSGAGAGLSDNDWLLSYFYLDQIKI